jgi:hypothetical protein
VHCYVLSNFSNCTYIILFTDYSPQFNEPDKFGNRRERFYSGHTYALALNEHTYGYSYSKQEEDNDNDFPSFSLGPDFEEDIPLSTAASKDGLNSQVRDFYFQQMYEHINEATPSSTKSTVSLKSEPSSSKFLKFNIKP